MTHANCYLGIDGGGTHTTAAIADEEGAMIGTAQSGPSLYKVTSVKGAMENIKKALRAAEKKAHIKSPSYAYTVLGLSGVDSLKDWKMLSAQVHAYFKPQIGERFRVVNDVVTAFAAGTKKLYGAAVIAGTGSNAYAVGPEGEAYASGLGMRLADEGSAYWIGDQMLRAAAKSFDGRGPKTALEQILCTTLGVKTARDLVDVVYQPAFDKTKIASLAPRCARAAARGDKVAQHIIKDAAGELAQMICAVIRRAGLARAAFDCVLVGGVWRAGTQLLNPFRRIVHATAPRIRITILRKNPAEGAARLALQYDRTK